MFPHDHEHHPFFHFARRGGPHHGRGPGGGGPSGPGGHGHGHGHGMPPFNFFQAFFKRGQRARRGDVRAGILTLLAEAPRNGYQIMQELETRSRGSWRPSPGSIYPALQLLEDEGLIAQETTAGNRLYALTDAGKKYVKAHAEELGTPWENKEGEGSGQATLDLMNEMRTLAGALFQLSQHGSPEQLAEAKKVLQTARRALYGMLAGSPEDDDTDE